MDEPTREVFASDSATANESFSIAIRHNMWVSWRIVAEEQLAVAEAALADPPVRDPGGTVFRACLVAITAAAAAVETLCRDLDDVVVDDGMRSAWARNNASAHVRCSQTLYHAVDLPQPDVDLLMGRLSPYVRSRGSGLHFEGEFAPPVPDPSGNGSTSREAIEWGIDNARDAVQVMRDAMTSVADHPKPKAAAFAQAHRPSLMPSVDRGAGWSR